MTHLSSSFVSINPADGSIIWEGPETTYGEIDEKLNLALEVFPEWSWKKLEDRIKIVYSYRDLLKKNKEELAEIISKEMGKPIWESLQEVQAMIAKVDISIESQHERASSKTYSQGQHNVSLKHKPHGVIAVFAPFNFPGHLPNGHIVPALLAGNCVLLKASEQTPYVAQYMQELWDQANLPQGVLAIAQGGKKIGEYIAAHKDIKGLLFTGSSTVGALLHQQFSQSVDKILALEMGGNNPIVVCEAKSIPTLVYHVIQSSFLTAGQRCTCCRRLILTDFSEREAFISALIEATQQLVIGRYDSEPTPFMGPVVSAQSAYKALLDQESWIEDGGVPLLKAELMEYGTGFISPGIIDMTGKQMEDGETFAPLLKIICCDTLSNAIALANDTAYGLSASIFTEDKEQYEYFYKQVEAGIINWNLPTNGANSKLPFGGVGISGNHRPSAYYAADYCAYPVASLESDKICLPKTLLPGVKV